MNLYTDLGGMTLISMLTAVAASGEDGTVLTATSWLQLVERFGIMAVILFYFVFRDYIKNREDKIAEQHKQAYLERVEAYVRDTLVTELQLSRTTIAKSALMMKRVVESTSKCPGQRTKDDDETDAFTPQNINLDGVTNVQKQSPSGERRPL